MALSSVDVAVLAEAVRARAQATIDRTYLGAGQGCSGRQIAGDEVAGRIEWDADIGACRVVIYGRSLRGMTSAKPSSP